jgi:hypothetical protein
MRNITAGFAVLVSLQSERWQPRLIPWQSHLSDRLSPFTKPIGMAMGAVRAAGNTVERRASVSVNAGQTIGGRRAICTRPDIATHRVIEDRYQVYQNSLRRSRCLAGAMLSGCIIHAPSLSLTVSVRPLSPHRAGC